MVLASASVPSTEIVDAINQLLPGFLAAWVFFSLTAHPRNTPFERTIQALIFTLIVRGMNVGVQATLEWLPQHGWCSFGAWTKRIDSLWSVVNAVVIGAVFALFANRGWAHGLFRRMKLTTRTSFPSEWFSSFTRLNNRWVILHLKDRRRLRGWPEEWPDQAESGHFVICEPAWILPDNAWARLYWVERLVIPAADVAMVEILKDEKDVTATVEERREVEERLVKLQKEDQDNGKQGSTTPTTTEYGQQGGSTT